MGIVEWILKMIFWSWFAVVGVCLVDVAKDLQRTTIAAYQKGPISARVFTRLLTEESGKATQKK